MLQIAHQDLGIAPGARVLLLAPGPHGHKVGALLTGKEGAFAWTLLDTSPERLKTLRSPLTNQSRCVLGRATRLPFKRHSFDAVVALETLFAIRPPWTVIAELHRVLAPEGKLVLIEPAQLGLLSQLRDRLTGPGKRVFTLDEIKFRLTRADYEIARAKSLRVPELSGPHWFVLAIKRENPAEPVPQYLTAREMIERRKNKTPQGDQLP